MDEELFMSAFNFISDEESELLGRVEVNNLEQQAVQINKSEEKANRHQAVAVHPSASKD